MSKRSVRFFSLCVIIGVLAIPSFANAASTSGQISDSDILVQTLKVKDLLVEKYSDGRLMGNENAKNLNENQKDTFLNAMGFTEDEISYFSDATKDEIIIQGGKKVNSTQTDYKNIFTSKEGDDYLVTPENKEEINMMRTKDLTLNSELAGFSATTLDSSEVWDGIFHGSGTVVYIGKTANAMEYKYTYRTNFRWNKLPNFYWTDSIGTSWATGTGVGSNGTYVIDSSDPWIGYVDRGFASIDQSSVQGTKGTIDLYGLDGLHYGDLATEVRIPVTQKGLTGAFGSAYGHAYSTANMDLVLNYASIYINGWGDKWTWRTEYTIGQ
ncbi:hypothetical protein A3842_24495 [Paenibacillus sp. P3E]|uniref:hypothetical protein n=1 Tax=Paenibacillus sp. P3E TaxID=1349435 RepID=UPI00093F9885|nr:hypothetical protein [Paenibacillus sp. P3E]OKP70605.1 hypothetical protein A3842_24495 [Paenibacillus sp. P3E]